MLSAAVQLDVEQRAEERAERVVRRRRLVLLAAQRRSAACRRSSPAAPGRAATFRFRARRRARRAFRSPSAPARRTRRALPARARDRRTAARPAPSAGSALSGAARSSPRTNAWTGSAFPLSVSGSSSVDSNDPPPRESAPAETQISSSPARAIRRAASAAVSPSTVYVLRKLAPTWPVNTRPSLTPMWTGSGRPASTIGANGPQHPLLVVAEGLRRARDEDDASAVAIDVAFEEGHPVLVRGRLDGADESVERVRCRLGSFRLDDLVRAGEADEGDRGVSVLSLERPDLEQLCAERRWDRDLERDALDGGERLDRAADIRCRAKQATVALAPRRARPRRATPAVSALTRISPASDVASISTVCVAAGPAIEQLAMAFPDQEELKAAGVEAGVHLQLDRLRQTSSGVRSRGASAASRTPPVLRERRAPRRRRAAGARLRRT